MKFPEHRSNRTKWEKSYLWWHAFAGFIIIACGLLSFLEGDYLMLVLLALIPQGVFQIVSGIRALREPSSFRLKKIFLLQVWVVLTCVYVFCWLVGPKVLTTRGYYDLSFEAQFIYIPIGIAFIQFLALTLKHFKISA